MRVASIIVFILSFVSLLISLKLFRNLGVFVDEHNLSTNVVSGSYFWSLMDWLRLLLLFLICVISGLNIFLAKKKS